MSEPSRIPEEHPAVERLALKLFTRATGSATGWQGVSNDAARRAYRKEAHAEIQHLVTALHPLLCGEADLRELRDALHSAGVINAEEVEDDAGELVEAVRAFAAQPGGDLRSRWQEAERLCGVACKERDEAEEELKRLRAQLPDSETDEQQQGEEELPYKNPDSCWLVYETTGRLKSGLPSYKLHDASNLVESRVFKVIPLALNEARLAVQEVAREKAKRERDLAIAHDRQPYPTADAYEKACAALAKKTDQLSQVREEVERLRGIQSDCERAAKNSAQPADVRNIAATRAANAKVTADNLKAILDSAPSLLGDACERCKGTKQVAVRRRGQHEPFPCPDCQAPDARERFVAELWDTAEKWQRERAKTKQAEKDDRASGKLAPDHTYEATWNYYEGLAKAYEPLELDTGTYRYAYTDEDLSVVMEWQPRSKGGDQ